MRRPYRERFRLIITELGTGLAGRPDDLQEVLRRAHPGLRETSRVLRILGDQNEVIKNFITDSDTVVQRARAEQERRRPLGRRGGRRRRDLRRRGATSCARSSSASRASSTSCGPRWRASASSPTSRRRCSPTSSAPRPTSTPSSRAWARSRRRAGRPFRSLGEMRRGRQRGRPHGQAGDRRAAHARRERAAVRQAAAPVPPDDRRPQARDRGRPAREGDRAAGAGSRRPSRTRAASPAWRRSGTTSSGRRSASTCSTTTAHILRASLTAVPDCAQWRNEPPKTRRTRTIKSCNAYLGPNQPGILSPDPLDDGSNPSAAKLRAESGQPASRLGEQRGEGQPEAGPLPGQPDLSKPQIVLPPDVQDLLDSLTPRQREQLDLTTCRPTRRAPPQLEQIGARSASDDTDHRPAPRLPACAMRRAADRAASLPARC